MQALFEAVGSEEGFVACCTRLSPATVLYKRCTRGLPRRGHGRRECAEEQLATIEEHNKPTFNCHSITRMSFQIRRGGWRPQVVRGLERKHLARPFELAANACLVCFRHARGNRRESACISLVRNAGARYRAAAITRHFNERERRRDRMTSRRIQLKTLADFLSAYALTISTCDVIA